MQCKTAMITAEGQVVEHGDSLRMRKQAL